MKSDLAALAALRGRFRTRNDTPTALYEMGAWVGWWAYSRVGRGGMSRVASDGPALRLPTTRIAPPAKVFASLSEPGGDRERHPQKLDAALGEHRRRLVDERGGISNAASAARHAWRSEAETSAQFEEEAATQVGAKREVVTHPHARSATPIGGAALSKN